MHRSAHLNRELYGHTSDNRVLNRAKNGATVTFLYDVVNLDGNMLYAWPQIGYGDKENVMQNMKFGIVDFAL